LNVGNTKKDIAQLLGTGGSADPTAVPAFLLAAARVKSQIPPQASPTVATAPCYSLQTSLFPAMSESSPEKLD
jgi:hypothetical protein